ncbi:hypothetical protein EB061_13595, partial [bacterium]|nr:hypothetical protein [bacterium]
HQAPRWFFFANTEDSRSGLRDLFPDASVFSGVDPRFERVSRRLESIGSDPLKNGIISEVRSGLKDHPRPVIIAGSVWPEDLRVFLPAFRNSPGSLVVVPHSLDPANLRAIHELLEAEIPGRYLEVHRMGVLVELYPLADAAFVGGGFGKGIHSTLEPAISGLPVLSGPSGVDRFPETLELKEARVLTVVRGSEEIERWLHGLPGQPWSPAEVRAKRSQYRALLEECMRIR